MHRLGVSGFQTVSFVKSGLLFFGFLLLFACGHCLIFAICCAVLFGGDGLYNWVASFVDFVFVLVGSFWFRSCLWLGRRQASLCVIVCAAAGFVVRGTVLQWVTPVPPPFESMQLLPVTSFLVTTAGCVCRTPVAISAALFGILFRFNSEIVFILFVLNHLTPLFLDASPQ